MTKGFVTMATGKEEYYILARNLLASYKIHNSNPFPFAIICDRENSYTKDFDDVVILDTPSFSFLDKLRLVDLSPYDENLFIDSDSLVCRDLGGLWKIVKDAPPFGIFGKIHSPDSEYGRIEKERSVSIRDRMRFYCTCQGGMYYIRKTRELVDFLRFSQYILDHFELFQKPGDPYPSDDNIFPLACSVFGYPPPEDWWKIFCFFPESEMLKMDIRKGLVEYIWKGAEEILGPDCYFVHFSLKGARSLIYRKEAFRINASLGSGCHFGFVMSSWLHLLRSRLLSGILGLLK
ncbi:MAG: hypothetical protein K6F06_09850 [Bacteroidales bacterium]|nr:hypothetical protein [Bacteroidales bacterium]